MIYEEICRHIRIIFQGKRGVGGQGGQLSSLINIVYQSRGLKVTADIISILVHNNTIQSFV